MNLQQYELNLVVEPELLPANQHKDTDIFCFADVIKF